MPEKLRVPTPDCRRPRQGFKSPFVRAEQLCFFKFSRPLADLLGAEFFRSAPAAPGVYLLFGEGRRVLYVGQSKNLRARLGYYKNAQPEREPRRIIRLVHQTRAVEWLRCETVAEAQARELELIQEHSPRFNVQHALSRTYGFFGWRVHAGFLELRLALESAPREEETMVGAFRNRGLCRRALFALGRTAWCAERTPASIFDLPMSVLDRARRSEVSFAASGHLREEIPALIQGESAAFAGRMERLCKAEKDPFLKSLFQQDHLTLVEFFDLAVKMRALRERAGVPVIQQRDVDRLRLKKGFDPLEGQAFLAGE
jgi:hypothetical protein